MKTKLNTPRDLLIQPSRWIKSDTQPDSRLEMFRPSRSKWALFTAITVAFASGNFSSARAQDVSEGGNSVRIDAEPVPLPEDGAAQPEVDMKEPALVLEAIEQEKKIDAGQPAPEAEEVPKAQAVAEDAPFSEDVEPMKEPTDLKEILRAQIFLDKHWFSPGRLDGVTGPATSRAVRYFNAAHGIEGVIWDKVMSDAKKDVPSPTVEHTVSEKHWKFITSDLPSGPEAQSKRKYMGYRTMLEMVMERFHCTEPVLKKLNPDLNLNKLKSGSKLTVPNVVPFIIEDIQTAYHYEKDTKLSARQVIVDTKARMARVYEGENLVAAFPIVPGQERFIHRGKWKLVNMVTTPTFTYDKSFLTTGKRSKETLQLPPGPNNPVGILWAGTSKSGIGLHGTSSPEIMNYARSSGCIRLANWDIARLHEIVRPGCEVVIK